MVPYKVIDRDAQGMVMSKIYGTAMDLPRICYGLLRDRFADEKIAPRIGLMTVF